MNAKVGNGYRCGDCSRVYLELADAAYCCASDRHPMVSCWRCYECGALYLSKNDAETCCSEKEDQ